MTNLTPDKLILVSHHLCPYVQRAAIALAEKGVPLERENVDLTNKPDWFKAISPLGKVPLLIVRRPGKEDATIFESSVICEYIEDTTERPLHPGDPLERARHRAWMEFGSSILADLWGFETATEAPAYEAKHAALRSKFARVEAELEGGPWFGADFSLVDAVYAPIFRYFDVFDTITPTGALDGFPTIADWRDALRKRPSVVDAVADDYPRRLKAFLVQHDAWLLKLAA